jgi:hypothetical protein
MVIKKVKILSTYLIEFDKDINNLHGEFLIKDKSYNDGSKLEHTLIVDLDFKTKKFNRVYVIINKFGIHGNLDSDDVYTLNYEFKNKEKVRKRLLKEYKRMLLIRQLKHYYELDLDNCVMSNSDWIVELSKALTDKKYLKKFNKEYASYLEERE